MASAPRVDQLCCPGSKVRQQAIPAMVLGTKPRGVHFVAMLKRLRRMVEGTLDRLEAKSPGFTDDDVDAVIRGMRDELVQTKARLSQVEEDLTRWIKEADAEQEAARVADRRAEQATRIGDEETVRIAKDFADRHRRRLELLVMKAETARREMSQLRQDVAEGTEQLKKAQAQRGTLSVRERRSRSMRRSTERGDATDAFDRMAERMEGSSNLDDAMRELDDDMNPRGRSSSNDYMSEQAQREARADVLLEELKRRMGEGR